MSIKSITIYDECDTEHILDGFNTEITTAPNMFARQLLLEQIGNTIENVFGKCDNDCAIFEPVFPFLDEINVVYIVLHFPVINTIIARVEMNCILSVASLYLAHATTLKIVSSIAQCEANLFTHDNILIHNHANRNIICYDLDEIYYTGNHTIKMDNEHRIMFLLECARMCNSN
jgi:hypothetical protein